MQSATVDGTTEAATRDGTRQWWW